jgi:hypothetical protein
MLPGMCLRGAARLLPNDGHGMENGSRVAYADAAVDSGRRHGGVLSFSLCVSLLFSLSPCPCIKATRSAGPLASALRMRWESAWCLPRYLISLRRRNGLPAHKFRMRGNLKLLATAVVSSTVIYAQYFQRLGTCPTLGCILPPDQQDFLPGQQFDIRFEVHAPVNGSEANGGEPDKDFTVAIAKGPNGTAASIADFFDLEEPEGQ